MEKSLKNLLREHGLVLKKAYGQNFLTDNLLLEEIVSKACVTKDDTVLEIGCGAGALTSVLSKKAKRVVGYEIDTRLKPVLNETLSDCDNVEIVFSDIMKQNLIDVEKKLGGEYIMVANLPYYITTPIIMKLLEDEINIELIEVMIQEEVALRFCAKPSSKDYGAITLAINYYTEPSYVISAKAKEFLPSPDVDSAVVKMDIKKEKIAVSDKELLFKIIKASFAMRRKTLLNSLGSAGLMGVGKKELAEILEKLEISENVRAENLSLEEYVKITECYFKNEL